MAVVGEISPDDAMWEGAELALAEPMRVELRAHSVGEGILVRGRMETRLELECRRCLKRVVHAVDVDVDLLY